MDPHLKGGSQVFKRLRLNLTNIFKSDSGYLYKTFKNCFGHKYFNPKKRDFTDPDQVLFVPENNQNIGIVLSQDNIIQIYHMLMQLPVRTVIKTLPSGTLNSASKADGHVLRAPMCSSMLSGNQIQLTKENVNLVDWVWRRCCSDAESQSMLVFINATRELVSACSFITHYNIT